VCSSSDGDALFCSLDNTKCVKSQGTRRSLLDNKHLAAILGGKPKTVCMYNLVLLWSSRGCCLPFLANCSLGWNMRKTLGCSGPSVGPLPSGNLGLDLEGYLVLSVSQRCQFHPIFARVSDGS